MPRTRQKAGRVAGCVDYARQIGDKETYGSNLPPLFNGIIFTGSIRNTMKKLITWLFLYALASTGFAQHVDVMWTSAMGGAYSDEGEYVDQRADGTFFVVANSTSLDWPDSSNTGTGDVLIMGLDSAGGYLWGTRIGTTVLNRIIQGSLMTDGNYVLIGTKATPEGVPAWETHSDVWIVKVTPTGSILWERSYGEEDLDEAGFTVSARAGGGCVVAGYFGDVAGEFSGYDTWVAALDTDGNELWQRTWGGDGYDTGTALLSTSDGGVVLGGTYGGSGGSWDAQVTKLDAAGNTQWQHTYGGSGPDHINSILRLSDGYLLVGSTQSVNGDAVGNHGGFDAWVIRLDDQGAVVWRHCYGGTGSDGAGHAMAFGANFLISGSTASPISGDVSVRYDGDYGDAWLLLINPDGVVLWDGTYGGSNGDWINFMAPAWDGFIFVGGSMSSDRFVPGNYGYQDFWAVRFWNKGSLVGGTLYADLDADAMPGPSDPRISCRLVGIDQYDALALTDTNGRYAFAASGPGTAVITPPVITHFSAQPETRSVILPMSGGIIDSLDFGYFVADGAQDLEVFLTPVYEFRPGFPVKYHVLCRNAGPNSVDATLFLTLGDSLSFDSATAVPSMTNGAMLSWTLGIMPPLQNVEFEVYCTLFDSLPLGSHVITTAQLNPVGGDDTPGNNESVADNEVVGSWDPNDIRVQPGSFADDELETAVLDYVIRFQNTGTADAIDIGVENIIPENTDASSFELIASSHPVVVEYYAFAHKLRFQFSGIHLPDSITDEAGSHGFVRYQLRPRTDLVVGDTISNSAAIFFDNNPAVLTNRAITIIEAHTGIAEESSEGPRGPLAVYPNPNNGQFLLRFGADFMGGSAMVFDALGRAVAKTPVTSNPQQLDITMLKPGYYHIEVRRDGLILGRAVVVKL